MHKPTADAFLVWASSFGVLAAWAPNALTSGDAALYALQIENHQFGERTVHLGYFLVGGLAGLFVDLSDRGLHLLSCFFAASCLALLYAWAVDGLESRASAAFTVASLLCHLVFLRNAVHAEVYMLQAFLLVAALRLWLDQRELLAGTSFALSTLVSPSTPLAVPSFWILRPQLAPLLRLLLVAALLLGLALVPVLDNYLFGPRGLLGALPDPSLPAAEPAAASAGPPGPTLGSRILAAVTRAGFEFFLGGFALLPLLAIGVRELFRQQRFQRFGLAVACLAGLSFLFGATHPTVPIQLPTYVLLALVIGLGHRRLSDSTWAASGSARSLLRWAWLPGSAALVILGLWIVRPLAGSLDGLAPGTPALMASILGSGVLAAALLARAGRLAVGVQGLLVSLLLINGLLAFQVVGHEGRRAEEYRRTVIAVGELARHDDRVLGSWGRGILFNYYRHGEGYADHWILLDELEGHHGPRAREASSAQWLGALECRRQIWLLGPYAERVAELGERGYAVSAFGSIFRAEPPPRTPGRSPGEESHCSP